MTRYTNIKMRISEGQKDKIKKAFECNCESIIIRFKFSDLHGAALAELIPFRTGTILPALGVGLYQDWRVQVFKS